MYFCIVMKRMLKIIHIANLNLPGFELTIVAARDNTSSGDSITAIVSTKNRISCVSEPTNKRCSAVDPTVSINAFSYWFSFAARETARSGKNSPRNESPHEPAVDLFGISTNAPLTIKYRSRLISKKVFNTRIRFVSVLFFLPSFFFIRSLNALFFFLSLRFQLCYYLVGISHQIIANWVKVFGMCARPTEPADAFEFLVEFFFSSSYYFTVDLT